MEIVALAGGIGAGKFLRGLRAAVDPADHITVIVNTGDDFTPYGLHVSPDIDSVIYWVSGAGDRERGWGRGDESFRMTTELRERFESPTSWFGLGDLDLATNLYRSELLRGGATLSQATARIALDFGLDMVVLPMSDDPVTTRILMDNGDDLHFQEYWVRDGAPAGVQAVSYEGTDTAEAAPGVYVAIEAADAIIVCPSNPVASIGPILAVGEIRVALSARSDIAVGISPIVGGAPLRGMADKLMPSAGWEVTAFGAAQAYEGNIGAWIIDDIDADLAPRIEAALGMRVAVTETIMPEDDDAPALALAQLALDMVRA